MKKFIEKLLNEYSKFKLQNKNEESDENIDLNKINLDDFDDWTEDEVEDLLTGSKNDLLNN